MNDKAPSAKRSGPRGLASKKTRAGARGVSKVKTGCTTCKIRHKKCDESRPSCLQCSSTGRRCEFSLEIVESAAAVLRPTSKQYHTLVYLDLPPSSLADHMARFTKFEADHINYFRVNCTESWAKYFEDPIWENLVLQFAHIEPSIYHAALAISALTRKYLSGSPFQCDDEHTSASVVEYSMTQYNQAIQCLNSRLNGSIESMELATLGSILFIHIEWLQSTNVTLTKSSMRLHLCGGLALVEGLRSACRDADYLESALHMLSDVIATVDGV
ncbi:hypothetical protein BX600DRAFT_474016 [Xylariales sp. PMI_506]|nr:hypothetical protein BX600DRAFT_474016 [Xylariales sp. PMI_506]